MKIFSSLQTYTFYEIDVIVCILQHYIFSITDEMLWMQIYTRCTEAYRLTQSGYLNIPSAATDQFCYGPCLAETHLVLDCVDHSLSKFVFYNKATSNDIRATLQAACSHTHERGKNLSNSHRVTGHSIRNVNNLQKISSNIFITP